MLRPAHDAAGQKCLEFCNDLVVSNVDVGILGTLSVEVNGRAIKVSSGKQAAILAVLALESPGGVTGDRLVEIVWDDPTSRASHALQQHVSTLRKLLEPERAPREDPAVLVTRRLGYELVARSVDLLEFESLATAGSEAATALRWDDALTHLDAALALWRGPALADIRGSRWFDTTAARLEDRRLLISEVRVEVLLGQGRAADAVPYVEDLLSKQPFRERSWGQLMLALYRSGRQADALASYHQAQKALVDELGLDPSQELRDLETAILRQDPSLDLDRQRSESPMAALHETHRTGTPNHSGMVRLPDGQVVQLEEGENVLGRRPDAHVRLADSRVSRLHAVIEVSGGTAVVRDLASTNGTTVNGRTVSEQVLSDGDILGLGGVELPYERSTPSTTNS